MVEQRMPCGRVARVVGEQPLRVISVQQVCPHRAIASADTVEEALAMCRDCIEGSAPVEDSPSVIDYSAGPHSPRDPLSAELAPRVQIRIPTPALGTKPRVDELLAQRCPSAVHGPSLFGRSKIGDFRYCLRRGYWRHIRGLQALRRPAEDQPERVDARELGSLVHAAIEAWYSSGADGLEEPMRAVEEHYPRLAAEARSLVQRYLRRWNHEERTSWDVRGVEVEARYYYPARKVHGAGRKRLCVTTRYDGLFHRRRPGAPHLAPGEMGQHMRIHEIKTVGQMSASHQRGFSFDAQILQAVLCYTDGLLLDENGAVVAMRPVDAYGALEGVTVSLIGKMPERTFRQYEHLVRLHVLPSPEQIEEYRTTLGDWLYEEVAPRLFSEAWQEPATWPASYLCREIGTGRVCPYLDLCQAPSAAPNSEDYIVDAQALLDREALILPAGLKG